MNDWQERFPFFRSIIWRYRLGQLMRIAGVVGVGISLLVMVLLPIGTIRAVTVFESTFLQLARETERLSREVAEVSEILDSAIYVLESGGDSLDRVEGSLGDTQPVIESAGELLSNQTPVVIENTIEALDAATTGARIVDIVLRGLASLEPLTGVAYDPEQPLDQAIEDVSTSLEPLPPILREVGEKLTSSTTNLNQVTISLDRMTADLSRFAGNVSGLEDQISTVADLVKQISLDSERLAERASAVMWTVCIVLEFILFWITLNQIALYLIGQQVIENSPQSTTQEI